MVFLFTFKTILLKSREKRAIQNTNLLMCNMKRNPKKKKNNAYKLL